MKQVASRTIHLRKARVCTGKRGDLQDDSSILYLGEQSERKRKMASALKRTPYADLETRGDKS
jgi:hypothetical protein